MSATFITWSGKPLPNDNYLGFGPCCVQLFCGIGISNTDWTFDFTWNRWVPCGNISHHNYESKIMFLAIPPNAAPEYIAWCHKQGIEVPGGEIKRVKIDFTGILHDKDLTELSIPEQFVCALKQCNLQEGATATLTLEMKL